MNTKKTAIIERSVDSKTVLPLTSQFIRNHSDPEQLFLQTRALYLSGQIFEVEKISECIIDEANDNVQSVDFFLLAAHAEVEIHGFTEKVRSFLSQALILDPFHDAAQAYWKMCQAVQDLKDGLYNQGENTLRECLKTSSLRISASYFLAHHLFWKSNDISEATHLLELVVDERPSHLMAWADLALAYKRQGERVKANHALQKCLKIDRESSRRAFYEHQLERQ